MNTPTSERMIVIDDIIELQTNSETEKLSFATRYLVYENFTFDLYVVSGSFCGTSSFCVRRDEIEFLCDELSKLHYSLNGSTSFNDNDSDGFVRFSMEQSGHVVVSGQVGGSHQDHSMRFKFQTDQTCIPRFVQDFKRLLLYQHE